MFDKVQEIRQHRHRRTKTGKSSIFSGLVYCAECGQKMYYCTSSKFEKRQDFFVCSTHRKNGDKCSSHYIRAVVLEELVWMHIQEVISCIECYEAHFRNAMEERLKLSTGEAIRVRRKKLAQAEKRLNELDRLFMRLYEDNVSGKVNDERFSRMSRAYEEEQAELQKAVQALQEEIDAQERQAEDLEVFVQRVHKYIDLDELTSYALRELVKAIYIEAPDYSDGIRRQDIHICYDLVGFIPADTLRKQETAWLTPRRPYLTSLILSYRGRAAGRLFDTECRTDASRHPNKERFFCRALI